MRAIKLGTIAGILFDKDGTLLDYDESWLPVNRELASIAAQGDAALANHLLLACGMRPRSPAISCPTACLPPAIPARYPRASLLPAPGWT